MQDVLDEVYIMEFAFSDLVSGLFNIPRGDTRKLATPPANCSVCGGPLIEIEFRKGFEMVCDNYQCYMFRQPQGCRTKDPQPEPPKPGSSTTRPGYPRWLEDKRNNYQTLRNLGLSAREASNMSSNKQTQLLLEWKTEGMSLSGG